MSKKLSEADKAEKFRELCETNPLMGAAGGPALDYQMIWSVVQLALPFVIMLLQRLQVMVPPAPAGGPTPAAGPATTDTGGDQPTDESDLERPPGQK